MKGDAALGDGSRRCSVVIPTLGRGKVLVETVTALLRVPAPPDEIILVDQTPWHAPEIEQDLWALARRGVVRVRLAEPSIPRAMNEGLRKSRGDIVLFLDDDIVPSPDLVIAHVRAHGEADLVAGQVLQPGQQEELAGTGADFRFNSNSSAWIDEFMGGNFSIKRAVALALGGFDENFVGAAYRFEAEFAWRYRASGNRIRFEPAARIAHLQVASGGTRAHGHHLRTARPTHTVGAYYCLLRTRPRGWLRQLLWRPLRAIRTRHHLKRPWWVPVTLLAELRGLLLAMRLARRGPRLLVPVHLTAGSKG